MSGEVTPYDPTKLMDAVRDRIKAEFVGLIPPDAWAQMVKGEVDRFFKAQDQFSYGYRNEQKALPSQFQTIVWGELEKATKERMKDFLSSPEWTGEWDGKGGEFASAAVKKLIVEKSGEIIANVLGNAMQATIESMRQRM